MAELSKDKMDELLRKARGEVADMLMEEVGNLRKALGGDGDEDDALPPGGGGNDAPPAAEGGTETPSETSASPGEAPGEASGAAPGGPDGGDGGGAGGGDELSMLVEEFSKMPPDQLAVYYQAIKAAMAQAQGGAPGGDMGGGPPAGGMPPGGAPGGAPGGDPAMKAMVEKLMGEVAQLKKSNAELEKKLKPAPRVPQPQRRAVTAADMPAGTAGAAATKVSPEKMTKSQITAALKSKQESGKLEKADREKITDYYNDGCRSIDGIKHLLQG